MNITPPTTARIRILTAFRARLKTILRSDGFATDAGMGVIALGVAPELGPADVDGAIAIMVQDDSEVYDAKKKVVRRLPVQIQALASDTIQEPWLTVEHLLGDIKRAIEREGNRLCEYELLRDPTVALNVGPDSGIVGIGIGYAVQYSEAWGRP